MHTFMTGLQDKACLTLSDSCNLSYTFTHPRRLNHCNSSAYTTHTVQRAAVF